MTTTPLRSLADPEISVQKLRRERGAELEAIARYRCTTDYLTAAQIYLKDNVLLRKQLRPEHIKDRLLGQWEACPSMNLVYAHLNRLIRRYDIDMFLVTALGGVPAKLANLYLEGSLQNFDPKLTLDAVGLHEFVKRFSESAVFPSHLYPGLPDTIHESGELRYALATAFDAVMDKPNLVVTCIVGDGDAETDLMGTAWNRYKSLDPTKSGAVLPILHLNSHKISSPTLYGRMNNEELLHLFAGYDYEVRIVENSDIDADMYASLDWAYQEICRIQQAARLGERISKPRWPLLILRSPKAWAGIKEINEEPRKRSYRSHQAPTRSVKLKPYQLALLENWLRSYYPEELFDQQGRPLPDILKQCPNGDRRMGSNPHTFGVASANP